MLSPKMLANAPHTAALSASLSSSTPLLGSLPQGAYMSASCEPCPFAFGYLLAIHVSRCSPVSLALAPSSTLVFHRSISFFFLMFLLLPLSGSSVSLPPLILVSNLPLTLAHSSTALPLPIPQLPPLLCPPTPASPPMCTVQPPHGPHVSPWQTSSRQVNHLHVHRRKCWK